MIQKCFLLCISPVLFAIAGNGGAVYAESASATQRILPVECKFTVIDAENQILEYQNPEECEPTTDAPEPPKPGSPDGDDSDGGGGFIGSPGNGGGSNDGSTNVPGAVDNGSPKDGELGLKDKIFISLATIFNGLVSFALQIGWLLGWMVVAVLALFLLVLIAFGGAGLSKMFAMLSIHRYSRRASLTR